MIVVSQSKSILKTECWDGANLLMERYFSDIHVYNCEVTDSNLRHNVQLDNGVTDITFIIYVCSCDVD